MLRSSAPESSRLNFALDRFKAKMLRALLVVVGFHANIGSRFYAMTEVAERLQIELGMSTSINQRDDVVELRLVDPIQLAPAFPATSVALLEDAILDVRRDPRVIMFADPFLHGAAHAMPHCSHFQTQPNPSANAGMQRP